MAARRPAATPPGTSEPEASPVARPPVPADEPPADEQTSDEDQGDTGGGRSGSVSDAVSTGAGWILGLLLWGWVGLPLINGGPSQVGKVLKAKFLNKAPDGTELP